ncbi:MAG: hypothetical protein ACAI44_16230 [Candidatus Sericytochromatia bacterium]
MPFPVSSLLKRAVALSLFMAGFMPGCKPQDQQAKTMTELPDADFNKIQTIIASSCMPCHNRQTLPEIVARTKKAGFKAIEGDTRSMILDDLHELEAYMESGLSISFTSKEELHKFFAATPGEFYMMLEKGLMPPPWAPGLMQEIKWPHYQPLSPANRVELLKYSKPYTEKYLR